MRGGRSRRIWRGRIRGAAPEMGCPLAFAGRDVGVSAPSMNSLPNLLRSLALFLVVPFASAAVPRDALPLDAPELPGNFRLHVEFSAPATGVVRLGKDFTVPLPKGAEKSS